MIGSVSILDIHTHIHAHAHVHMHMYRERGVVYCNIFGEVNWVRSMAKMDKLCNP